MDDKIDLNRASVEELAALKGFGMKLAQRIVAYREEVHPFAEVIELTAVPGVSERMVRAIEDIVMVTAVAETMESVEDMDKKEDEEIAASTTEARDEAPDMAEAIVGEETAVVSETPELEIVESDIETTDLPDIVETAVVVEASEPESDMAELPEPVEAATLKEQIEMAESRPEPEGPTPPPPAPAPVVAPRSERTLVGAIIGAIFGAIIGVVLTLTILSSLNGGTLSFASQERAMTLQQTVDANMEVVRGEQSDLSGNVETLSGQLATVEAEQARMDLIQAGVDSLQATAVSLEGELAAAEEQLESVAESAQKFDTFLNGLRDLLFDFQGAPPTPTPTETATPTPTLVPTETMVATATAVPTETQTASPATRTPRPTATPLVTATATE